MALAQSYDTKGRRIVGVDFDWDVDGVRETADGDLYRYEFKSGKHVMVTANRAGHSDSAEIQSNGGFVDSSNRIGCAATGGSGALVALAVIGLVVRRRRR